MPAPQSAPVSHGPPTSLGGFVFVPRFGAVTPPSFSAATISAARVKRVVGFERLLKAVERGEGARPLAVGIGVVRIDRDRLLKPCQRLRAPAQVIQR
jgi:hypothetical protein